MPELMLVRHGQSQWNLENRFTGWTDVDLTSQGEHEARQAGNLLAQAGHGFDLAYTSVLKRAVRTLWLIMEQMDLEWIPQVANWRLNERHYGALQGLNKAETAQKHGDEQVRIWRRSFDVPPPPLDDLDPRHPRYDKRYASVDKTLLPAVNPSKTPWAGPCPFGTKSSSPSSRPART